jgi:hypothetical protein
MYGTDIGRSGNNTGTMAVAPRVSHMIHVWPSRTDEKQDVPTNPGHEAGMVVSTSGGEPAHAMARAIEFARQHYGGIDLAARLL